MTFCYWFIRERLTMTRLIFILLEVCCIVWWFTTVCLFIRRLPRRSPSMTGKMPCSRCSSACRCMWIWYLSRRTGIQNLWDSCEKRNRKRQLQGWWSSRNPCGYSGRRAFYQVGGRRNLTFRGRVAGCKAYFGYAIRGSTADCSFRDWQPYTTKSISLVGVAVPVAKEPNKSRRFTLFFLQIMVTFSMISEIGIMFIIYSFS